MIAFDADTAAYQRFLGAARQFWAGPLFQALRRQSDAVPAEDLVDRLASDPTHQAFAWLERHLQRLKYAGRWSVVAALETQRHNLEEALRRPLPPDRLTLDPHLTPPAYYDDFDIHQHPGGLWGDLLAGHIYRESAGQAGVVGKPQLHDRFAGLAVAGRTPCHVVDLGCGFGRSSVAFATVAGDAAVTGIDLSEGCLRLAAHSLSDALADRIAYRQADATATGLPTAGFDLVTSTMLLHELPEQAVRALVAETGRLLAPGGLAAHLDFLPPAEPLLRLLHEGHGRRNNEPYMTGLGRIDWAAIHAASGFSAVAIHPFEEEDGALQQAGQRWRLPWTVILASKAA